MKSADVNSYEVQSINRLKFLAIEQVEKRSSEVLSKASECDQAGYTYWRLLPIFHGDVSERFMVTVLKTVDANNVRGFKSYHLRQSN